MSNFELIIPVNDDSVTIKDDELFSHFVESNVGHKLTQKERNMKLFCSATTIDQALTEVNSDISENLKNHLDNITRQYYINNYDLYCDSTFSEKESKPKEEKKDKEEKKGKKEEKKEKIDKKEEKIDKKEEKKEKAKTERVKSKKSKKSSKKSKSNKLKGGTFDSDSTLSISTESNLVYSSTSEF